MAISAKDTGGLGEQAIRTLQMRYVKSLYVGCCELVEANQQC